MNNNTLDGLNNSTNTTLDGSGGSSGYTPDWYKALGVTLALTSGLFIGSSFIFKKKGLLDTNALGHEPAKGHAYLKSPMWWTGMILMGLGEVANFGAYAFTPAILVTPLGALSVVISAVLSSIFLKERLNFSAKIGCLQCVLGAIIIVLNAPENNSTERIWDFVGYVVKPFFLVYFCLCFFGVLYLIKMVSPVYGEKHPIVYISICSIVGSFLVLSAQGFGAAMAYSFANWHTDNQFTQWPLYPTLAFVIATVVMQINYLNKALNLFSTAIVTPVYYVFFTGCTLLSSAILFQGFKGISVIGGISILIGFVIIVGGVALLFQYSLKLGKFTALQQQQQNGGGGSPITSPAGEEDEEDAEIRKNAEAAALVVNKYKNKHSNSTNKLNGGSPVKSANVSAHELFPPKQIDSTYRDGSMDSYAVEMDHLNNGGGGGGGVRLTNKNIGQILTSSPLQKKSSSMDPDKISLVNSVAPSTKRSFDDHLIDVSPDKSTAAAGPVLVPSRTSITLDRPQPITTATTSITTAAANGNGFGHHYQESSEATARASNSNLLGVDVGRRGSNAFLDEPL